MNMWTLSMYPDAWLKRGKGGWLRSALDLKMMMSHVTQPHYCVYDGRQISSGWHLGSLHLSEGDLGTEIRGDQRWRINK
jgi:hypothetical protein